MKKNKISKFLTGISGEKWLKRCLHIVYLLSIIVLLFAGWATQEQSTINKQLFLGNSRLYNGIGVLFLLLSWIFWEMYISPRNSHGKLWKFITAGVLIIFAIILINGILGFIAGAILVSSFITIFFLDYFKVLPIVKGEK